MGIKVAGVVAGDTDEMLHVIWVEINTNQFSTIDTLDLRLEPLV